MNDTHVEDGHERVAELVRLLESGAAPSDPRTDVDFASLLRRYPHLAHVATRDLAIESTAGPVPGRVYRAVAPVAGLVWVHGGAFVAGDLDMPESNWVALELASRGISVLALDYRKALGGVQHPAPSDDVLAGWLRAVEVSEELMGVPTERLHLGGASAGANLIAGVALRLRDGAGTSPASLALVYPVLHPVLPAPSAHLLSALESIPAALRLRADFVHAVNLNYVGSEEGLLDAIAFAGLGDLRGLPRTLVMNAEADDLRSSGERFAEQLEDCGVRVQVEYEPGTTHGYLDCPGDDAAIASIARLSEWVRAD